MPWISGTRTGFSPSSPCYSRHFSQPPCDAARRTASCEIEEQQSGGRLSLERDGIRLSDRRAIAGLELIAIERDSTAHDLDPDAAPRRDRMGDAVTLVEECGIEPDILVDGDGAVAAISGADKAQPAVLLRIADALLFVARRQAAALGDDPDL